jgi:hypothetical protein
MQNIFSKLPILTTLIFTLKNRTTKWYDFAVTPYFSILLQTSDESQATSDPTKIRTYERSIDLPFF